MKNVELKLSKDKDQMIITVDLSKNFGPSKSGKTTIIATTGGNQDFEGVTIGLNVYKKL